VRHQPAADAQPDEARRAHCGAEDRAVPQQVTGLTRQVEPDLAFMNQIELVAGITGAEDTLFRQRLDAHGLVGQKASNDRSPRGWYSQSRHERKCAQPVGNILRKETVAYLGKVIE
jgi:hypothetical protein